MARHAAAHDLAFEHAERGEQGRRAVAFVIVREGCAFPRFSGRPGWVRDNAYPFDVALCRDPISNEGDEAARNWRLSSDYRSGAAARPACHASRSPS